VLCNGGVINGEEYKKTLQEFLLPHINLEEQVFMQYGAPAHRSKLATAFLVDEGIRTLKWPA
jgi:hypothetical protein